MREETQVQISDNNLLLVNFAYWSNMRGVNTRLHRNRVYYCGRHRRSQTVVKKGC